MSFILEQEQQKWMSHALALAERAASLDEVPVGAVVVANGEIIGEGWNRPISGHDPTAHAEIMALREAAEKIGNYRLVDADLYVTIEPCTMCSGAIVHARIRKVFFGATEPKSGAVVSNAGVFDQPWMNYRVAYQGGVLADECSRIISEFFQRRREQKKAQKKALKASVPDKG